MKVYLAAPWLDREYARTVRDQIQAAGIAVTSHWLDFEGGNSKDPVVFRREAQMDWADVLRADALVLLNIQKSEGKATEQGLALQAGKPIVAIGKPMNNVFHYLPNYVWVDTVGKAIEALEEIGVTA